MALKSHQGFTLIEIIITSSILAAILTLVGTLASTGLRSWAQNRDQVEAQETGRTAFARVSKLIREAQPADNGSYTIAAASDQSLTFYADADNDGANEQVRIFLQGTQLKMGVIKPTGSPVTYPAGNATLQVLANNIRDGGNPIFTYFDGNFTGTEPALTTPIAIQNVRLVHVKITVDADTTKAPNALILETNMAFRNLKDNL